MAEIKKGVFRSGFVYDKNEYQIKGLAAFNRAYANKFIGKNNGFYVNYTDSNENDLRAYIDIDNDIPDDLEKAINDSGKGFNITKAYTAKAYEMITDEGEKNKIKVLEKYEWDNWYMLKDGNAVCKELVFIVTEIR